MNERRITLLALILAVAALGHSLWLQSRAEKLADEALRRRERELVEKAAPKVRLIAFSQRGMGDPKKFNPTTIEELFKPFADLISNMTGVPSSEKEAADSAR